MTKAEKIAEMLRRFEEARETMQANGAERDSDGGLPPLMPVTWNESYRELERCLVRMRESRGSLVVCSDGVKRSPRSLWWHVTERYLRPKLRRQKIRVKYDREGKPLAPAHSEIAAFEGVKSGEKWVTVTLRVWSHEVVDAAVSAGLDWLALEFRGEPYMPTEMLAA